MAVIPGQTPGESLPPTFSPEELEAIRKTQAKLPLPSDPNTPTTVIKDGWLWQWTPGVPAVAPNPNALTPEGIRGTPAVPGWWQAIAAVPKPAEDGNSYTERQRLFERDQDIIQKLNREAAQAKEAKEGRTFLADESALERAGRERLQGAFREKAGESALERAARLDEFTRNLAEQQRRFTPGIDALINQRIISGEFETPEQLAYINALADFRDRPTSQQALDAALAYARAPADVFTLSNIARGNALVTPPPEGQIQRIGPPAEFLTDAYTRYLRSLNPFQGVAAPPAISAPPAQTSGAVQPPPAVAPASPDTAAIMKAVTGLVTAMSPQPPPAVPPPPVAAPPPPIAVPPRAAVAPPVVGPPPAAVAPPVSPPAPPVAPPPPVVAPPPPSLVGYNPVSGWNLDAKGEWTYTPPTVAPVAAPTAPPAALTGFNPESGWTLNPDGTWTYEVPQAISPPPPTVAPEPPPVVAPPPPVMAAPPEPTPSPFGGAYYPELGGYVPDSSTGGDSGTGGDSISAPSTWDDFSSPSAWDDFSSNVAAAAEDARSQGFSDDFISAFTDYSNYDFFAHGGVNLNPRPDIVGEFGPELVNLPLGTRIRPFRGNSPIYPAGVRQALSGRSIGPPQSLYRAAGLTVPSAQAWRNLLPSERAVYGELGQLAGIPQAEFQRELLSAVPGQGRRRLPFRPFRPRMF